VGGGSITQFGVDSSPYAVEVDGGVAPLYLTGPVTPVASGTRQAAARMSNERVMFTTGPPRENMTQGFQDLTTAGEFTILPAGDTGVFHDLTGIWIYSTNASLRFRVFLRDSLGGPVRFPVNISAGGGSNNSLEGGSFRLTRLACGLRS
jgi:hypothetical protein